MSIHSLFNDSWQFAKFPLNTPYETMSEAVSFCPVAIPHDWQIWDTSDLYENSIGFYKKVFTLKKENFHTYIIRFDAVYMDSSVYLNHEKIFEWKYGYSAFDVDITKYVKDGENLIEVSANYQSPNTRWYSGAGIFRNVHFFDKDSAYIPLDGLYVSTRAKENGSFDLMLDCDVNVTTPAKIILRHTLTDATGEVIASFSQDEILSQKPVTVKAKLLAENPRRWDIDDPYLYTLKTDLIKNKEIVDSVITNVGFRTIRFDSDKGFFLNERSVKINGACMHHDLGSLGAALNKTALRRQFAKLKEMGINSVRTSHNMPAPELLDLADEMGILINTEAFDMWENKKTEYDYARFFPDWYIKDVRSWVLQDRNHPSVIIFSIGNEIYDCHLESGRKWNALLRDEVRKYDYNHNAYIGSGSNYMEWENAQKCADDLEIAGYNYGEKLYDAHHEKNPSRCIFGSETASTVQSRGIYHFPLSKRLLTYEDGQCSSLGNCSTNWGAPNTDFVIHEHKKRDFAAGQYIWTGWDYIGEPTPYFTKNSYFGQIDTAGFEKDSFYQYKAEWTDFKKDPMVHVLPYWDFNDGQTIDVCVYSNAPKVSLFLNDELIGEKAIDHNGPELKAVFTLPYKKGLIKAVAYDENEKEAATDIKETFGDSKKIVLKADKSILKADTEDLIFVEISTVDKDGKTVENARNRINLSVTGAGRLVGVDNGDSTDYEQYKGTSRKLFSGKLIAIIASDSTTGTIELKAESPELESASITLNAVSADVIKGASFMDANYESEAKTDIPIRKIELINQNTNMLTAECPSVTLSYKVYPENATFDDISVSALTIDAVEANFAKALIDKENKTITVTGLGDGDFRLTVKAGNGSGLSEIISVLEFNVSGMGSVTLDPYEFVPGIQYAYCSEEKAEVSFEGGVFIPAYEKSYITYENVDFGEIGSDEISVPIFIFENELPLSIYEGTPENGECLGSFTYKAISNYNHYQANTFKLSRRIKGIKSVSFVFETTNRISLKGFSFKKYGKAYETNLAVNNNFITGDTYTVTGDSIEHIGNNVCIEFDDMDFNDGISAITVCGRSNNSLTSMHILFTDESGQKNRLAEIEYSEEYGEYRIPLQSPVFNGKVSFVFLPGTDFDFKWFRFEK